GTWVAAIGERRGVALHLAATGKALHWLDADAACIAFFGDLLAVGGNDSKLRLWNLAANRPAAEADAGAPLRCLVASPNGKVLASGDEKGVIRLWDVEGKPLGQREGHVGPVLALEFLPDGRLASSGADRTVRLWKGP